MPRYIVTMTSPIIEADTEEDAIAYAEDHGGNHWRAVSSDVHHLAPVTVEALREDWTDNPHLTDQQKTALQVLDDARLVGALEKALDRSAWYEMLDNVRGDATRALLHDLGIDSDL